MRRLSMKDTVAAGACGRAKSYGSAGRDQRDKIPTQTDRQTGAKNSTNTNNQ